jgi:beta-glucosidase
MNILYSEGVTITDKNSPFPPVIKAYTYQDNAEKIRAAVETAKKADVVVLFVGDNEGTSREAYGPEAPGDLPTLELLAGQKELIQQIAALGKPTCAFVNSGTTLSLGDLESKVPAVMECWYLGQEGGYAMIDALFGDVNPSGKLSISFPRSAGHIPAYYNYKTHFAPRLQSGLRCHSAASVSVLDSVTLLTATENLRIDRTTMGADDTATVSVDVKNTGNRDGAEIVQLYITDDYSSLTRPVKELKGFRRINLKAGESQTVSFKIDKDMLAYYDSNNRWQVEPGTFTIAVGPSSAKNDKTGTGN